MSALRPDFLNLRLWAPRLQKLLGETPHILNDMFGNTLSTRSGEQTAELSEDLQLRGRAVARLRCSAGSTWVKPALEMLLEAELRAVELEEGAEAEALLSRDISALLALSDHGPVHFEELLQHALRILRAHCWAETAAIFGMLDGFTLKGLVAAGWGGTDWKSLLSVTAGIAASTKAPFTVEDPQQDKNLAGRPGVERIRGLRCLPLLHGKNPVGVLVLTNTLLSDEGAGAPLPRLISLLALLIQRQILSVRVEESERTSDNLGKYLSKKVVKNVEDTGELMLGGVEKKVVCLFSDIRGYTTITEGIAPATLVKLLNFHFERMHAVIERNEGTLDKIVGDLVMAVWNIPKDQPDPELLAMKAALEMQKEMIRSVIPEWQRHGVEKVGMGVGVNSGTALAGNLGSSRFMNYTVIGDAVNTAQRLESKAKAGEIWMNEAMYPFVHGKIEKPVRRELEIRLKGKEQTINALVYRPLNY